MKKIKAYKVFDKNLKCMGYQYEVGKLHKQPDEIRLCENGLHACTKAADCFDYWGFNPENRVCEVELSGEMDGPEDGCSKIAAEKLKVVKELTWHEVLGLVNTGHSNSGHSNSGDWNSGDWNSGDWNSGDSNSGDWNSGDWNSGIFNSKENPIMMFNKKSDWYMKDWLDSDARRVLRRFNNIELVCSEDMTDDERKAHPYHETTGGFLKETPYKEAFKDFWEGLGEEERESVKSLPNFDAEIFEEITGVKP